MRMGLPRWSTWTYEIVAVVPEISMTARGRSTGMLSLAGSQIYSLVLAPVPAVASVMRWPSRS
jgi:hypothetical protein